MGRRKKSERVQVTVNGEVVGSLYARGLAWWFDCRTLGVRRFVAMKTRDLEEALRKAKAESERGPVLPGGETFQNRASLKSLEDALDSFKAEQQSRNRPSSVVRVMDTARRFVAFVGGEEKSPRIITRAHLVAFRDHRKGKGISYHTVNTDLQRVKVFVNFLRIEGLVDGDPTFKVRRLKVSSVAPEAPTLQTVEELLKACDGHWLHDYVLVLANVGLRPQEALHIRACDVESESRLLHVRPWGDCVLKDHESRTLALNDAAFVVLSRRKLAAGEGDTVLFPSPEGRTWDYRNFAGRVWRKELGTSKLSAYELRHFFAS